MSYAPPQWNYPPPPMNGSPPANVVVMPPPPPVPIVSGVGPAHASVSSAISQADSSDHQAPPLMTLSAPDKFPTLIVLKTGAYTVNKYRTKGKILYFETTSGENRSAPLSLLERIVPAK
jgi:hypothetical protein